jgi:Ca2+-binding EF-hand superfamily protein
MGACLAQFQSPEQAALAAEQERLKKFTPTPELTAFCDQLRITDEKCQELYEVFRRMDLDGSGSVEPDEMYAYYNEVGSPFIDQLGPLIGLDRGAPVFFYDFVRITAIFSFFDERELVKFCFDTFDCYQKGAISHIELAKNLHVLSKLSLQHANPIHEVMQELDVDCDFTIDFEQFLSIYMKFPKLLWPVHRLQHRIRHLTLGVDYWRNQQYVLFGLRQTRTVNQVALMNEQRAADIELRNERSRDPESGELRVPISSLRIGSLPRTILVEAPAEVPREFVKRYARTQKYLTDAATFNHVSLATKSLYRPENQLKPRALDLKREDVFTVSEFVSGASA